MADRLQSRVGSVRIRAVRALGITTFFLLLALIGSRSSQAVPPLVAGDVEPAGLGRCEVYLGRQIKQSGSGEEKATNLVEIVYGNRPNQEITVELPYLTRKSGTNRTSGLGDVILGTKYQFARETRSSPAMALSMELKLANASVGKGLGSGAADFDIRWRVEKWLSNIDTILNVGYILAGDPKVGGSRRDVPNVGYWALAGRWPVSKNTRLLGEIYGNTPDEHGGHSKTCFNVGFDYKDRSGRNWHAAWGHVLSRPFIDDSKKRLYIGSKLVF